MKISRIIYYSFGIITQFFTIKKSIILKILSIIWQALHMGQVMLSGK